MYDKFGLLLRIETVINCPGDSRCKTRPGTGRGAGGLETPRQGREELPALPRNRALLQFALSRCAGARPDCCASYKQVRKLVQSQPHAGRRYAGFNVAKQDDVDLFAAVLAVKTICMASEPRIFVDACTAPAPTPSPVADRHKPSADA